MELVHLHVSGMNYRLFSGLHISQANYLYSIEICGTACSRYLPIHRRVFIVLIISTSIVLAATISPSSAILLIPRLAYWPAGNTDSWLNATFQDIQPDRLITLLLFRTPVHGSLIRYHSNGTNGSTILRSCRLWDPLTYDVDCPSSDR